MMHSKYLRVTINGCRKKCYGSLPYAPALCTVMGKEIYVGINTTTTTKLKFGRRSGHVGPFAPVIPMSY